MKRCIGYWLKQNRNKSLEWLIEHANAPLNHMFNDHSLCDSSWCWVREQHDKNNHKACKEFWNSSAWVDDMASFEVQTKSLADNDMFGNSSEVMNYVYKVL